MHEISSNDDIVVVATNLQQEFRIAKRFSALRVDGFLFNVGMDAK